MASCGQLLGDFDVSVNSNRPEADAAPTGPVIVCELGVTRCDGRLLQLCVEDGTAWTTLEPCATAELCEASDVSTVSGCIPPACSAEQMSCDGNLLRSCNASRTGWELFDTCQSAAHCDAGKRQCLQAPCDPGDRRCNVGSLERCNDLSTGWEPLDTCVSNELCEATITPPATVGEVLTTAGVPAPPPASNGEGPIQCREPVCVPREVRCDVARLNACNEGQTDLTLAEECATEKLCEASITYTGLRGSPRCVRPACAAGEHRCTEEGVLELCNADRDGFDPIEACIGPPFCNAVAADNGGPGCEEAPCDPGEEQCNGPQIQRCLADQTAFEAVGAPCETRGLCNDDNPTAFCAAAACQRGPLSGTEFRCEGATLQRCNDQHTGYDSISTCATPGLCNAGFGFNGCQAPVCATGETRCSGNFVQRCNDQRTGFVNIEQCAQGTCDGFAGRCADPCTVGTARCNAQGNLEECRDLLVGREVTARCGSIQLCDAAARTCRTPPAGCTADGVRRCRTQGQGSVLEVCADGRSRFNTLDTCAPGEICDVNDVTCDVCAQGSQATCEGNNLVTCALNGQTENVVACPNGCQTVANAPDRCRTCVPGSISCTGDQLVVCRSSGTEEFLDREFCDSAALCQQTLAGCNAAGSGQNCRCQPGVCSPGDRDCDGSQPVACNADQTALAPSGPDCVLEENCRPAPVGQCFACGIGDVRCGGDSIMEGCRSDRGGFEDIAGATPRAIRCVSDNAGVRAQSCNGATLQNQNCASGLCNPQGGGCSECDPQTFVPTCAVVAGVATQTRCNAGGEIVTDACRGGGVCTDVTCGTGGTCDTDPRTGPCSLPGGGTGTCDGNAVCVACLQDSECAADTNPCTRADCNQQNACVQVPDPTATCPGGTCNAQGECVQFECQPGSPPTCDDNVAVTCSLQGTETRTTCQGGESECRADQTCSGGACVAGAPASNTTPCTGGRCDGAGRCVAFECTPGVTPPSCDADGDTLVTCSAQGTFVRSPCQGGGGECRADQVCSGGACVAGAPASNTTPCTGGTCNGAGECIEAPQLECQPGSPPTCDGNTAVSCSGQGTFERTLCQGGGSECRGNDVCQGGGCVDGAFFDNTTPCAGGTCNGAGTCVPAVQLDCQPGSPPTCEGAATILSCSAQGTFIRTACQGGGDQCRGDDVCQGGGCVDGAPFANGTGCAGGTCNGNGDCIPTPVIVTPPDPPVTPPDPPVTPPDGNNGNGGEGQNGGNGNPGNGNGNQGNGNQGNGNQGNGNGQGDNGNQGDGNQGSGDGNQGDGNDGTGDTDPGNNAAPLIIAPRASVCGNGICEANENVVRCVPDCLSEVFNF